MGEHIARMFWLVLTCACIVWYMTIVIYVAIRGASDIRRMLGRLAAEAAKDAKTQGDAPGGSASQSH